jgi:hypothetical protein
MFEITGDDIAALGDTDLRTLIGLLCEAELRRRALAASAVTWGGNQTAKDGGLDVRVCLPVRSLTNNGFIPSPQTGFQVKKPDMPRSAILDEMKPNGTLRPVILELAQVSGAYVIASATGSTADSALTSRREAMAEAVKDTPAEGKLTLDFYDRNRLATWVRDHAGMIPWVRSRIGRAVPGWRAFGAWSHAPANTDASYLTDDRARIRTGAEDEGDGLSATEGINRIRNVLRAPGHIVRLVGLSGVGKTRLAEALFDPAVGMESLDPSLAIYTNVAESPDPPPVGLASDLVAANTRAILVIDNCPPDLHRQLSEVARSAGTTISVITVEYDIREDQPEGTDVFSLDTTSPALIETLVARRYPAISQVNAHTIAEFSGGNARVALALAATVGKSETLAGLSDADLFKRLFQQRHDPDASLLAIAQACSLVYSFEGEKLSGDEAELPILGSLVGKSAQEVYTAAAELKRRDLLQERGPWRAVLPHAVANNLAKLALQNIPPSTVQDILVENASERMLRSFSRRLGYLDGSKEAKGIVSTWLAPGGLLADLANLSELGRAIFHNIAPIMPAAALSALEHAFTGADEETLRRCMHFVRLLRSLAYDAEHFERATALLIRLAVLPGDTHDSDATNVLASLFPVVLSGTHAPVTMRLTVVAGLLRSKDAATRALWLKALEEMLKSDHFSSHYEFEFGARSRDYGYYPKTGKDVADWFKAVMELAAPLALSQEPIAPVILKAIASEFRSLWANGGQADALDALARAIAKESFWRDGWVGARQTRIYEGEGMPPELLAKLTALEKFLRPKDLVSKVRGLILGSGSGHLDLDDIDDVEDNDFEAAAARATAAIKELGKDVAADQGAFQTVLPDLMHGNGNGKLYPFGLALGEASEDPRGMWGDMRHQLAATEQASASLHCGFLSGLQKRDRELADALLDEALNDATLAAWFPVLQACVEIDARGVARLHRALELGRAAINNYYNLAYGRACDGIPGPEFRDLVKAIGSKTGGIPVALQILSMRLHSDRTDKCETVPEVAEAGRALLAAFEFHGKGNRASREDHDLGIVIRASLTGPEGESIARRLCRDLLSAVARYEVQASDHDDLLKTLFQVHPVPVLDELFSGDEKARRRSVQLFRSLERHRSFVVDAAPDDVVLDWCDRNPEVRYPIAAAVGPLFKKNNDGHPHQWMPLAHKLLRKAPEPQLALNEIIRRLHPSSWSGSLATILESHLKLLDELPMVELPDLRTALDQAKAALRTQIAQQRQAEAEENRARSGRFE